MDKMYLAVDAGTSVVKAALGDNDGSVLDVAACRLAMGSPKDGWCEMDMEEVWQAVCRVLRELRENNARRWPDIGAVGICAQGDGLWPIDKSGAPVRPAILWNDTRAAFSPDLFDYGEVNRLALEHCSSPLFTGAAPVLLRWMKDREPANYRRTAHALRCKDWLNYRLTGAVATDQTDASTALLNIHSKQYELSLLDALDIRETERCYPQIYSSSDVIGEVTGEAGRETGIPKNVPVIAGAIDVLAAATGCGLLGPGQRGSILGTMSCSYVVLDEAGARKHAGLDGSVLCHTIPGVYIRLMAALSGASSMDWVQREIFCGTPYPELEAAAGNIPVGSEGVLFHPYLFGERAPFRAPAASGAFFGLRAKHTKYHIARAAFEGLVLSLYDCYLSLPAGDGDIVIAGGAAKSGLICQMIADCIGARVTRDRQKELGIAGIIRMLRERFSGCARAAENAGAQDYFEPDGTRHAQYQELYSTFINLRQGLRPWY